MWLRLPFPSRRQCRLHTQVTRHSSSMGQVREVLQKQRREVGHATYPFAV